MSKQLATGYTGIVQLRSIYHGYVDTNIWVSALYSPGKPRAIADALDANRFVLVCSDELLDEVIRVVGRPKFAVTIPPVRALRIIALIRKKAVFVRLQNIPAVSRDPKDDIFLACAATGSCDFLVTGNKKDLLDLKKHGCTSIVTAAQFLKILDS